MAILGAIVEIGRRSSRCHRHREPGHGDVRNEDSFGLPPEAPPVTPTVTLFSRGWIPGLRPAPIGHMGKFSAHLRTSFLAGIFAAIPVAVTIFIIWYVERATREVADAFVPFHVPPFVGVAVAIVLIYVLGVFVTSLVGRQLLRIADSLLGRLPIVRTVYVAWKHVALTPGGGEGMFAKVVLIRGDDRVMDALIVGFTSGRPVAGMEDHLPVFVPQCPNPINGRLLIVPMERCRFTDITADEALKMLLSTGNYLPDGIAPPGTRGGVISDIVLE